MSPAWLITMSNKTLCDHLPTLKFFQFQKVHQQGTSLIPTCRISVCVKPDVYLGTTGLIAKGIDSTVGIWVILIQNNVNSFVDDK